MTITRPTAKGTALLALLVAAATSIIAWQLNNIDKRLEERLSIYQQHQQEVIRRLERLEDR